VSPKLKSTFRPFTIIANHKLPSLSKANEDDSNVDSHTPFWMEKDIELLKCNNRRK
jgi:hypothetical protein